jgi:hypothetical protein
VFSGGVGVNRLSNSNGAEDIDGLRLLALGRIPRCADCKLYRELRALHDDRSRLPSRLPQPSAICKHKVCAPLAVRLSGAEDHPIRILRAVYGL